MNGETIATIVIAVFTLDIIGLFLFLYFHKRSQERRKKKYDRIRREVESHARTLSEGDRERCERQLREANLMLEHGSPNEALEVADQTLAAVFTELNLPVDADDSKRKLEQVLFVLSPDAAGHYAEAHTRRRIASELRREEKSSQQKDAARGYLAACESLIRDNERPPY